MRDGACGTRLGDVGTQSPEGLEAVGLATTTAAEHKTVVQIRVAIRATSHESQGNIIF